MLHRAYQQLGAALLQLHSPSFFRRLPGCEQKYNDTKRKR